MCDRFGLVVLAQMVVVNWVLMGIPNVKRFRAFCPECKDSFTVMAVLPSGADVDAYVADAVARHDHKAHQESKLQHFRVRVGQQKQRKSK